MLDMRDNMLAADLVRFGGANQDLMWNAFAQSRHGQGRRQRAERRRPDAELRVAVRATNATVTLRPVGDAAEGARSGCTSGDYEARATPGRRHRPGDAARRNRSYGAGHV